MKQNFIIRGLRGSVFMPQITFNWEFISAIQTMLPNYIPSVISDTPQVIKGMLLSPGDWILSSPDDNIRIVFQAQKVDYIINTGEFYQFNLSSCIRQQNSLTAQFVSFSLSNLANIFYPPQFLQ